MELKKPDKHKQFTPSSDYGNSEGDKTLEKHNLDIDAFNETERLLHRGIF